ncbi:MAG: peptidoglycan recognition family protein [Planctomycetota bacterium]
MNWLTDMFSSATVASSASGRPVKRRRSRPKFAFKKISVRTRRILIIAMIAILAAAAIPTGLWLFSGKNSRSKFSLRSLFPAFPTPSAPGVPAFEDEALATDPGAQPRRWRYIVIHHSGGNTGSAQSFDAYHRETKGWQSLGYHFVIGNGKGQADGKIAPGPRWYGQQTGAHAHSAEHNEFGIGICLVGNFDALNPTTPQWQALIDLVKRLSVRYSIPARNIVGHSQIRMGGTTACPGKNFNVQALRDAVLSE